MINRNASIIGIALQFTTRPENRFAGACNTSIKNKVGALQVDICSGAMGS